MGIANTFANPGPDFPPDLADFAKAHPSVLIETQRLGRWVSQTPRFGNQGNRRQTVAVDSYAKDLKQRLERALAANSLTSQRLDRTFPARILNLEESVALTEDEIRATYARQSQTRERLAVIGLVDQTTELPLPSKKLEPWQRRVLTTYVRDADEKLASFDDLVGKIDLLEGLLNGRFLNKSVQINTEKGLAVYSGFTGSEVPVTGLSSGEQHELVLFYNLLFTVTAGSLVLIDEPEISLHVSWQKAFLDDVVAVGRSSQIHFLIATHSPQIIGRWWSRTFELGPSQRDSVED